MAKQDKKPGFQTHIPEPRWQQIASVIFALFLVALWLWLVFHHHH